MGCSGGRGEPWRAGADLQYSTVQYSTVQWRAGADLALEHAAGVGGHVVEDDVGGRGVAEHLQPRHQEHGRARVLRRDVPGDYK